MLSIPPQTKQAPAQRWLAATVQTYPGLTAQFLLKEKDLFRNPVGAAIKEGIPRLIDELFGDMDAQKIAQGLEGIVRIRAVQNFTARQAVGFVFLLKKILRDELPSVCEVGGELDARVDGMALAAFDHFMRCREQVYEIRLNEAKRNQGVLEKICSRDEGG
jgi:RsbT co-antagonist protein rsbRD N-terminal domain